VTRGSDTIFALSSAPGRAGIAVVRVSGPMAGGAILALTRKPPPEPRRASVRQVFAAGQADGGGVIDRGLVLWLPGPESATGEDVAEFHVHGGRAILDAVLSALAAVPELRPAERGEFTRRSVENGKLDLTQAEGLADLIEAETESQRRQALSQYQGAFFKQCEAWRTRLLHLCAWAEAAIDFSDEDLGGDLDGLVSQGIRDVLAEMQSLLADGRRGEITRDGFHLTVIGPPNAGKSSLINALARRDVAIVAETPGTTRDVLEARLDLGGYLVIAADTAGLREAGDAVEAEGVRRALARAESADLVLLLLDGTAAHPFAGLPEQGEHGLTVWNKADLPWPAPREGLAISARTGEGIEDLVEVLAVRIRAELEGTVRESAIVTRERHRRALEQACAALARAAADAVKAPELIAEDLRLALRAVGRITGRVDVEELLDLIFMEFCIGK
jgi:tRNA modification GTPase